ncbi:MAG: hypothetical protein RMJ28_07340 [Nitrososphaerota archaeon]|nr:hypothetical protein [Candidatus Calditenuaceae archaeon]MDW8074026.1 hypothetical protein [Nitrososphaerota archaeon]
MVALSFRGEAYELAREVLWLLVEASRSDEYLRPIAGDGRHCHGYGYVAALKRSGLWRIVHERFDAEPSLAGEEACEANLEALGEAVERLSRTVEAGVEEAALIVHSRRTRGEPRGAAAAHPFREEVSVSTGSGPEVAEIFLSHNGGVQKEELAARLGVDNYKRYVDSQLYLKYLARRLDGVRHDEAPQALAQILSESRPLVKSALNLCMLLNSPSRGPMLAAASYVAVKNDSTRWRYYEPVIIESRSLSGYVSSTIRDLLRGRRSGVRVADGRDGFVAVLSPDGAQLVEIP